MRRISRAAALVAVALGAVAMGSTGWLASLGGRPEPERMRRSPQYAGGKFRNRAATRMLKEGTFWQMARHQVFGGEERVPRQPLAVVRHGAADYAVAPAGLRATWIGHASVLLEIDGRRVLTDPIWSDRCSPSTLVGPRRFHAPPVALADLPPIDAVVISHDHYDHLDMATVQALKAAHFAVPLGVGAHLLKWGIAADHISELDWGESAKVNGLTLTATPAQHYSGRNPLHRDETLWASWVIAGPQHRAFFTGDSGYFDGFRQIGASYGPFDLALVKIGACDPTWQEIHMCPEEAVQAGQEVGARLLLPVHWATFNLAFHAWNEPAERALAAAQKAGIALATPRPGEFVDPQRPQAAVAWWR